MEKGLNDEDEGTSPPQSGSNVGSSIVDKGYRAIAFIEIALGGLGLAAQAVLYFSLNPASLDPSSATALAPPSTLITLLPILFAFASLFAGIVLWRNPPLGVTFSVFAQFIQILRFGTRYENGVAVNETVLNFPSILLLLALLVLASRDKSHEK